MYGGEYVPDPDSAYEERFEREDPEVDYFDDGGDTCSNCGGYGDADFMREHHGQCEDCCDLII